jgi:hypothetical protein
MQAPTKGALTNSRQIHIQWTTLVGDDTGGSLISSYNLEWDKDGTQATFYEVVGQSLSFTETTFVLSDQVITGKTYHFRVRAKNKWGFGPYSPVIAI